MKSDSFSAGAIGGDVRTLPGSQLTPCNLNRPHFCSRTVLADLFLMGDVRRSDSERLGLKRAAQSEEDAGMRLTKRSPRSSI